MSAGLRLACKAAFSMRFVTLDRFFMIVMLQARAERATFIQKYHAIRRDLMITFNVLGDVNGYYRVIDI